jgi:hypothetical protein
LASSRIRLLILAVIAVLFFLQLDHPSAQALRGGLTIPILEPTQDLDQYIVQLAASLARNAAQHVGSNSTEDLNQLYEETITTYKMKVQEGLEKIEVLEQEALVQSKEISQGTFDLTTQLIEIKNFLLRELRGVTEPQLDELNRRP